MLPTLRPGDQLVVDRSSPIRRGDLVVVRRWAVLPQQAGPEGLEPDPPDDPETRSDALYVMRVLALPGDEVSCCDGEDRISVAGVPVEERYVAVSGDNPSLQSSVMPEGRFWAQFDSRYTNIDFQELDTGGVVGRVFLIHDDEAGWQLIGTPNAYQEAGLAPEGERFAAPVGWAVVTIASGVSWLALVITGLLCFVRRGLRRRRESRRAAGESLVSG
jgi:signal peptidase I